jgi:hypothetical protein
MESETYRGYHITAQPNGHGWRVSAHPLSPDLPITTRVAFHVDAEQPEDALAKVKEKIDSLLSL